MASSLPFFFFVFLVAPSLARTSLQPKALVLPITKDPSTLQYLTTIHQRTPLVPVKLTVDLGGVSLWVDCENGFVSSSYKPSPCDSSQCKLTRSYICTTEDKCPSPKPGCFNHTCNIFPNNPIATLDADGQLGQDVVSLKSTDGSKPGAAVSSPNVHFSCGITVLLANLSAGVTGMAGLGRDSVGLPSQLASAFAIDRKFAICLSSVPNKNGVVFFGQSHYVFSNGVDYSKSLTYTDLIVNPVSTAATYFAGEPSADYFIGVTSIKVFGETVALNTTLLAIDKQGFGGTKISTLAPYTVLETSIYKAVVSAFMRSFASRWPPVKPSAKPVAPFGACYERNKVEWTLVAPGVPGIELVLGNGVKWSVFGANSMVKVSEKVLCLGLVDGGVRPRTSVMIGGHQIEDIVVQFDIANNRLGFSDQLSDTHTSCVNFTSTS